MAKTLCSLLCILVLAAGCDRHLDSRDPVRSLPDAPPSPHDLTAQINGESIVLHWEFDNAASIARFRIYMADAASQNFTLKDSTTTTSDSVVIAGLALNRTFFFEVASVDASGFESERSAPITVRLSPLSMTINGDSQFTNRRNVQLQFTVSAEVLQVILAEDKDSLETAPVLSFSPNMNFNLSAGDGTKTVYADLILADGVSTGTPLSDDIILDTRAAIDSVYFQPVAGIYTPGETITFSVQAADGETDGSASVSFGGQNISLFDDGSNGDAVAGDGVYSSQWVVPNNTAMENESVSGAFTDAAGNRADSRTAAALITIQDIAPLEPVTLAGVVADSTTIRLSWSRFQGSNFSAYQLFRDTLPPVAGDSLDLSTAQSVAIINSPTTDSFNDFRPVSGTYYYQLYVTDQFDRRVGSNVVSVVK